MSKLKRAYFAVFMAAMVSTPFFLPGPDGKPVMTIDDLLPDWNGLAEQFMKLKASIKQTAQGATENDSEVKKQDYQPISVYRWQDTEGNWHFSDEVPESRKGDLEVITVDSSRIAPLPKPRKRPEANQKNRSDKSQNSGEPENSEGKDTDDSLLNNPLEILKKYPDAMQEAESAKKQFNEKLKKQKEILDNL